VTRQPVPPRTTPTARRIDDWRVFRPAIWVGMLGIAMMLVFSFYIGLAVIGGAIGMGARIQTSRRRLAAGRPVRRPRRR
jgi:hypothetical protein